MSASGLILPIATFFVLLVTARAQVCPSGQFLQEGSCVKCPPGTWKRRRSADPCEQCPKGTYSPYFGAQGIDVCKQCPENTFNNVRGATSQSQCLPCPRGQFSPQGSLGCLRCKAGERALMKSPSGGPGLDLSYVYFGSVRFLCFEGTSLEPETTCTYDAPIEYECAQCPSRSFTSKPNAAEECEPCPAGTSALIDPSKCLPEPPCLPGFYRTYDRRCSQCTRFQVSDGTTPECRECPPGFRANKQLGGSKCLPCRAGTAKSENQSKCTKCKPGENSSVSGASFCLPDKTPCAPNFFRDSNGACAQCTVEQRFDPGAKRCVPCPENSLSKGALSTTCMLCPPGTDADIDQARCVCKLGYEVVGGTGPASGNCRKCRPGTVRDRFSRSFSSDLPVCRQCPRNTFAPSAGLEKCIPCPKGFTQPLLGQSKCVKFPRCRKGLISSDRFGCVIPETNCPPNTIRSQSQDAFPPICKPRTCPPGFALLRDSFCGVCFKDESYNAKFERCDVCADDETSNGGLTRECTKCPVGMLGAGGRCLCIEQREMKDGKCMKCPKGTYGFKDRGGCEPCQPGTFSSREGSTKCSKCQAGTFTDEAGSSACKPCPSGTTSFGQGESGCVRPGSLDD